MSTPSGRTPASSRSGAFAARRWIGPLLPAVVLLLGGCAGAASAPPPGAPEIRRGVEGTERVVQRGQALTAVYPVPRATAWTAMQTLLTELEIQPTTVSPGDGRLFADGFRIVRLADRRASVWVDCGTDLNGPVADAAQVLGTLRLVASPEGAEGTRISIQFDAEARARGGMEGVRSCTSTGRLEERIFQTLSERLGAG
ncbi:MAG: hypothetical protein R3E98_17520 [Gemmatimonadota bacterium]